MSIHGKMTDFAKAIIPVVCVAFTAIGAAADVPVLIDPWAAGDTLVAGNTAFAFDLYGSLSSEANSTDSANLFFSPYSISSALAMTYAGAREATARQMDDVLQFGLPQDQVSEMFARLIDGIRCAGCGRPWSQGRLFELSTANSLWVQDGYELLQTFLNTLEFDYRAPARRVDFLGDPEGSRMAINDWVVRETRGRIEDLLSAGVITPATRMILVNAIYFYAAWADPFSPEQTYDAPFTLADGSVVPVATMHGTMTGDYARVDGVEVIDLPFAGGTARMTVLLPDADRFDAVEQSLDAAMFEEYVSMLDWGRLEVAVPKFRIESKTDLSKSLIELGMSDAFNRDAADFSGMDGSEDLFIGKVIHQAFVEVREEGTEAAAATAVLMMGTGMPPEPVEVSIDRPFIFAIRETQTGTILFLGRVLDPRSGS